MIPQQKEEKSLSDKNLFFRTLLFSDTERKKDKHIIKEGQVKRPASF